MNIMDTKSYRKKYAKKSFGKDVFFRHPPGGADVIRLCDAVDRLIQIVREIQFDLPTEEQNEVERKLWNI